MEYLPQGYGGSSKLPVIIALHGHGDTGSGSITDLNKVNAGLNHGITGLIAHGQWPADRPFVVLAPQYADNATGTGYMEPDAIHNFIQFAISHYQIDTKRIYLTGLSDGAASSSNYLGTYGNQEVAAAVLISGDAEPAWEGQGCSLVNQMGLWAFHGDNDLVVSISYDNTYMPDFLNCPQPRKDVQYTVYPGAPHDVWTRTYDLSAGHDIYSWFLTFSK